MKRGDHLGDWELQRRIGEGGNGEVWEAERPGYSPAALKLLHRVSDEGFERFKREIEIASREDAEELGLLPVWDSHVPEPPLRPDDPAWYVMPLATSLGEALGEATFSEKVDAMRQVAACLAVLVERFGLNHRDVKLANLYWWRGRVAVGDLGLARRPEDADLSGDRPIGPFHHLPSEVVVGRSDEIDWEKVDVHCLANTTWQLIADTRRPPRGHISANGEYDLARETDDEQAHQLALIIDAATAEAPRSRPTLAELAGRLEELLATRELTDVIRREDERIRGNANRVLRWLVAHVQAEPVLGRMGWECADPAGASGIDDMTDGEVDEAIEELVGRHLITAEPHGYLGGRRDWSRVYPTTYGISQVEDIDVLLARAAPILRQLLTPKDVLSISTHASEVDFGGFSLPPAEAYFLFRILADLGYVSYANLAPDGGGDNFITVKTTPTGRDWLLAHYGA